MSFKPYTEKMKKKKIGICSILGRIRIRIRIHHPGSGSADPDPDPHQNDTDPKHCVSWFYELDSDPPDQVGQLIMNYTPKKVLPFAFFLTYQSFKSREGIFSETNLAE